MKEYFKLAWRNIWRNRRRTLITAASIFFALFLALVMRSFQLGSYSNMLNGVIESYSGHLQLQNKDYLKNPSINNSLLLTNELINSIETTEGIKFYDTRIQSGLLASSGDFSKLGFIIGVNPKKSAELTGIDNKIISIHISEEAIKSIEDKTLPDKIMENIKKIKGGYYKNEVDLLYELKLSKKDKKQYLQTILEHTKFEGNYLSENDNGVLIGYRLGKFLNLNVGDSIILMGQGYHGETAIGKYPVKGFLKFASFDFNNTAVYMELKNAQKLFSAYQVSDNIQDTTYLVNYIAINTKEQVKISGTSESKILAVKKELKEKIADENISILFWKKGNVKLVQQIDSDNISSQTMVFILYIIIGFGVFGTVLMMVQERKREFGVMIAIGMKKTKLIIIVFLEMLFMGFIGIISGFIAAAPIISYYHFHPFRLQGELAKSMEQWNIEPIMPMEFFDTYCINQVIVVVIMIFIATLYPMFKISRLNVIKSLRG